MHYFCMFQIVIYYVFYRSRDIRERLLQRGNSEVITLLPYIVKCSLPRIIVAVLLDPRLDQEVHKDYYRGEGSQSNFTEHF